MSQARITGFDFARQTDVGLAQPDVALQTGSLPSQRLWDRHSCLSALNQRGRHHTALIVLAIVFLAGCGPREEDVRRIVREEMSKAMERKVVAPVDVIGPYSPAVKVGGFLFVSGQIGLNRETGQLLNESIEAETRQVLENIGYILRSEGYDSSHVVNATVYLKNMNDYAKMNLIYGGYFQEDNYPARTAVAVTELPRGANVEIAVVAYK